jgi:hypothetical protein
MATPKQDGGAKTQAAWIAAPRLGVAAAWAATATAALAYLVIIVVVLGALLSTVDSFR